MGFRRERQRFDGSTERSPKSDLTEVRRGVGSRGVAFGGSPLLFNQDFYIQMLRPEWGVGNFVL